MQLYLVIAPDSLGITLCLNSESRLIVFDDDFYHLVRDRIFARAVDRVRTQHEIVRQSAGVGIFRQLQYKTTGIIFVPRIDDKAVVARRRAHAVQYAEMSVMIAVKSDNYVAEDVFHDVAAGHGIVDCLGNDRFAGIGHDLRYDRFPQLRRHSVLLEVHKMYRGVVYIYPYGKVGIVACAGNQPVRIYSGFSDGHRIGFAVCLSGYCRFRSMPFAEQRVTIQSGNGNACRSYRYGYRACRPIVGGKFGVAYLRRYIRSRDLGIDAQLRR